MQTEHLKRKKLATLLALMACATLTGCATTTGSGATECARWKPIYWSKDDTTGTIGGVKEHNRVWQKLCGGVA